MEDNLQKEFQNERSKYSFYEWHNSFYSEIEEAQKEAESNVKKFLDLVGGSPINAIEYYGQDVIIAYITLSEMKKFRDKIETHPSIPIISIIEDTMNHYLRLYKHHDFRHNSTSIFTNAINIFRNQAFANIYEMFERACKLYTRIKQ